MKRKENLCLKSFWMSFKSVWPAQNPRVNFGPSFKKNEILHVSSRAYTLAPHVFSKIWCTIVSEISPQWVRVFANFLFARVSCTKVTRLQAGGERICAAGGLPSGTCRRLMTRHLPAPFAHLNHSLGAELQLSFETRTPSLVPKQFKKMPEMEDWLLDNALDRRTHLGLSRQE